MTFHPTIDYRAPHRSERKLAEPGGPFAFTPENRAELEEICKRYPPDRRRSAILPALHLAQRQQGCITVAVMRHVAEVIGCTPADIEDVVSFYTMYYTKPVGRYVLQVCRTLSCALGGAGRITEELCDRLNVGVGQTDPTGTFTVLEVECLGACDRAPVVMVNDEWHEQLAPEDAGTFLDDLRARGEKAVSGCHLKVGTRDQGPGTRGLATRDQRSGVGGQGSETRESRRGTSEVGSLGSGVGRPCTLS